MLIHIVKEAVWILYFLGTKDLRVTSDGSLLSDDEGSLVRWELMQEQSEDLINACFTMVLYVIVFKM